MQFYISHTRQIKRNFHNSIKMKYNLDVMSCHVMSCLVLSCLVFCCLVFLVLSCLVFLVLSCLVLSCLGSSRLGLSCCVVLCYVVTPSLADIQALVFLLIHSQNVNWITRAQINPRREKMQISFYINQFHLWNNSMFLERICFFSFLFCARFFICIFIFFYL